MIPDDEFPITEGMTIDDDTMPESDERSDGDDDNVDDDDNNVDDDGDDGDFDDDDDVDDNIPHRRLRISKSRILNELPGMDQN